MVLPVRARANQKECKAYSLAVGGGVSPAARLLGSACSGVVEILGFHPVDTVAKRLMSNQKNIGGGGQSLSIASENLKNVVFRDAVSKPFLQRYFSLFPGLSFAAGYKILQRTYKFGGQPFVKDILNKRFGNNFRGVFGDKHAKTMMHATAGSMVGIGEVVLLPLDVLKIKAQTAPQTLKGRGIVELFRQEGMALYRGTGWTIARNAPGSFSLFGAAAVVKEWGFELEDYNQATWGQNFVASIAGASASITVASPTDVIKTRIQNRPFDSPVSGLTIIRNLVRDEGPGAFFKGLAPKIVAVGPKLVFSFTIAQTLISHFHSMGL